MKILENVYRVELSIDDIDIITTALNSEYKHIKELRSKAGTAADEASLLGKQNDIIEIRNTLSCLIGRHYFGEDA